MIRLIMLLAALSFSIAAMKCTKDLKKVKLSNDEKTFLKNIIERIRQKNPDKTEEQLKQIYQGLKILCKTMDVNKKRD